MHNDGIIHDIRKHTRSRYHELKKLKKKQDVLKRNELTNSILTNKTNDFWQCVRKIKNNKTSPSDFTDGVSGEEVCDVFKNKYIGLYQKCKK